MIWWRYGRSKFLRYRVTKIGLVLFGVPIIPYITTWQQTI